MDRISISKPEMLHSISCLRGGLIIDNKRRNCHGSNNANIKKKEPIRIRIVPHIFAVLASTKIP